MGQWCQAESAERLKDDLAGDRSSNPLIYLNSIYDSINCPDNLEDIAGDLFEYIPARGTDAEMVEQIS